MSKLCVIISCYEKHYVLNNIYSFLENITDINNIDFYMVNNNIEKHDIIKKMYNNKFKVIKGDNSQYEFSGIQKCIEILRNDDILKEYNVFLLGTDALFNHPIYYFDFINKDLIDYIENNEICIGNIDTFNSHMKFDDIEIEHWIRSSMIFINYKLLKKIDYKFITYNYRDYVDSKKTINIDKKLKDFLNKWLSNKRYKYLDTLEKKNIKLFCIYNEWKFTNKIEKYGKIYDFVIVYYFNYINEIMTKNNTSILLNSLLYIKKDELSNLSNISVKKQLEIKNNIISK
jgi:hypothetical protein